MVSWSRAPETVIAPVVSPMSNTSPVLPLVIEYESSSSVSSSVAMTVPTEVPVAAFSATEKV